MNTEKMGRKLVLNKETVKALTPEQLQAVAGGTSAIDCGAIPTFGITCSYFWTTGCGSGGISAEICHEPYGNEQQG